MALREDANRIIEHTLSAVKPDAAVSRALRQLAAPCGRLLLVAAGKAAWQMAYAAKQVLGERISEGVVITKYGHVKGEIEGVRCFEAGHPVVDENSLRATQHALGMTKALSADDTVLFLLSGGGSALFELPLIPLEELADINTQLLRSGADITEINTVRKRLSAVKAGRFAQHCTPAQIFSIVLSDVIGDPLDVIASGPAYPDSSTAQQALAVVQRYALQLSDTARNLLATETPKQLGNVQTHITGSVRELCAAAAAKCRELGYETVLLSHSLTCTAMEAAQQLTDAALQYAGQGKAVAVIAGGEMVVQVKGKGLGGRNQELALWAAKYIAGREDIAVFSVGSDGTDGPTDAAGGYADGSTAMRLAQAGADLDAMLADNDSYHALQRTGGLIFTGPTGTNVNDFAVALVSGKRL